jgi:hypothetical protein
MFLEAMPSKPPCGEFASSIMSYALTDSGVGIAPIWCIRPN